jgi:hypothetical protein
MEKLATEVAAYQKLFDPHHNDTGEIFSWLLGLASAGVFFFAYSIICLARL